MKQRPKQWLWLGIVLIGIAGLGLWQLRPSTPGNSENRSTTAAETHHADGTAKTEKTAASTELPAVSLAEINLNQPARYAFISDKTAPTLAVFDTYERQVLAPIALKARADTLSISRFSAYLAYAQNGTKELFQFDLKKQQHRQFNVSQAIEHIAVHFGGRWIAYTGKDGSGILDTHSGKETIIATQGAVSLLYPPGADSLLLAETTRGRLQRINLTDGGVETLIDSNQPMSAISVMPNGMALFFVADGFLHRYSLLDNTLEKLTIRAKPWRPYITADSRLLLLLSTAAGQTTPQLLAVNTYTYQEKYRFDLPDWQAPDHGGDEAIATGWLEQTAVIADNNTLYSLTLSKQPATQRHDTQTAGGIRDMLVQSNSKTLLATRDNSDKLWLFNLREQRFEPPLTLGLAEPNTVVMGETNTLCH